MYQVGFGQVLQCGRVARMRLYTTKWVLDHLEVHGILINTITSLLRTYLGDLGVYKNSYSWGHKYPRTSKSMQSRLALCCCSWPRCAYALSSDRRVGYALGTCHESGLVVRVSLYGGLRKLRDPKIDPQIVGFPEKKDPTQAPVSETPV